jgi:hypothetical protein
VQGAILAGVGFARACNEVCCHLRTLLAIAVRLSSGQCVTRNNSDQ